MEKHEKIIKSLDEAFEKVDASFENDELRVFGTFKKNSLCVLFIFLKVNIRRVYFKNWM